MVPSGISQGDTAEIPLGILSEFQSENMSGFPPGVPSRVLPIVYFRIPPGFVFFFRFYQDFFLGSHLGFPGVPFGIPLEEFFLGFLQKNPLRLPPGTSSGIRRGTPSDIPTGVSSRII